ncbi:hypothetical protein [Vibrio sp. 99-8-1]|nr:hypothetical protein [Vibrio sp. 99-8-1]
MQWPENKLVFTCCENAPLLESEASNMFYPVLPYSFLDIHTAIESAD